MHRKLKESRGDTMLSAAIILLVFCILLAASLEVTHVWSTSDVIKEHTKEAVLAVAAINVENVYNGVRESTGQARAVNAAGTAWGYPVSSEEVMDVLASNMGLSREGNTLTKYTEDDRRAEFVVRDLRVSYNNVESGLNFIATYELEITMRIGKDVLPPICIPMEVRSTYEKLF